MKITTLTTFARCGRKLLKHIDSPIRYLNLLISKAMENRNNFYSSFMIK